MVIREKIKKIKWSRLSKKEKIIIYTDELKKFVKDNNIHVVFGEQHNK